MDGKTKALIFATLVVIVLVVVVIMWHSQQKDQQIDRVMGADLKNTPIRIASWNLKEFGPTKSRNLTLLFSYTDKIRQYDIVFLQEIKDGTDVSFADLCLLLVDYNCLNSSRAGRTSNKEQYGVIYKKDLQLINYKDYNPDSLNRWERPPFETTFEFSHYNLTFFVTHIKPADVQKELKNLEALVPNTGNVAIIGDMNADCDYYNPETEKEFDSWVWVVKDTDDTSVSNNTHCAYDRIILNDGVRALYSEYGIDSNVTSAQSDHYLIWFSMSQ